MKTNQLDWDTVEAIIDMIDNKLINNYAAIIEKKHNGEEITEAEACMNIGATRELKALKEHLEAYKESLVTQAENNLENNG